VNQLTINFAPQQSFSTLGLILNCLLRACSPGLCVQVNQFTINFGPQHPAAHGVLRLVLEMKGEKKSHVPAML
jgi:hypothetical protein